MPRLRKAETAFHNGDAGPRIALWSHDHSDYLAYTVAYEHTTASVRGAPPAAYILRVTTVFHREDGEWKVVHRHADPLGSPTADEVLQRLAAGPDGPR
jgi:ketosteroid isomerase-like protein